MYKRLITTALAAALLTPLAAQADHGFFISAQVGKSQSRDTNNTIPDYVKRNLRIQSAGVLKNISLGWRWKGMIGPEIGYTYLGRPHSRLTEDDDISNLYGKLNLETKALLLGINGRYAFAGHWYATAHAGLVRARSKLTLRVEDHAPDGNAPLNLPFEFKSKNSWYAGLGVGYDFSEQLSLGLNYDFYDVKIGKLKSYPAELAQGIETVGWTRQRDAFKIAAYSVSVEYRF